LLQNKPQLVEPLDFENFLLKNKTVLQNDPQRELLLYPSDDISEIVLPRRYRTLYQTFPSSEETENCGLFTKQCIASYSSNWNLIHYKYNAYSGTYADLPKIPNAEYKEENYEIDIDTDAEDDVKPRIDSITKEGYLMKGQSMTTNFSCPWTLKGCGVVLSLHRSTELHGLWTEIQCFSQSFLIWSCYHCGCLNKRFVNIQCPSR
jgi:hypothetical protein